jgi:hypothetical protein
MAGLRVFRTVQQAIMAGYQCYDRTREGWVVRRRDPEGLWEMALVLVDRPYPLDLPDEGTVHFRFERGDDRPLVIPDIAVPDQECGA